jgi:hypothetical protein
MNATAPERQREVLEERQIQRGLGRRLRRVEQEDRRGQPEQRLPGILVARDQALRILLRELEVVVPEADESERERDAEHHPHETVREIGPQQRAREDRDEDQHAAHRRRAGLGEMRLRAVVAHHLADLPNLSFSIIHGPSSSASASAVITAKIARTVRYEKTLNPE